MIWIKYLKNKYIIALLIFLGYMLFIDSNNFIRQYNMLHELNKVEKEREYYLNEIQENKSTTEDLLNDIEMLERYAREKFLMKREEEDIFLIVRPKNESQP
ncbi:MAG: septum formation initiator family protein [Bacteroidales bacterium]|nr:septum formation initiator family protein [Bacteroidales bacterium]MDD4576555.1 septum formation initiator family protein [Bacteroidales bacterium]